MSVTKRTEGKGVLGQTVTTVSITKSGTARERKEAAAALSAMASTEQFPARAVVQNYKQAAKRLLAERGLKFGDDTARTEPIEREAVNVIVQALAVSRYMDEGNIDAAVYCAMELSDNVWRIGIRSEKSNPNKNPTVKLAKEYRANCLKLALSIKPGTNLQDAAKQVMEAGELGGIKVPQTIEATASYLRNKFPARPRGRPSRVK